ncbi:hypothetical protein D7147_06995 [Micromonospora musae]|uniref:GlsB/YeaQ/YmgE family stress response membrane protein n=1 Tax=Micromonospora musae TaxID=1894970 RepID=A0ABX9RFQ6_9ACTN|nr:hypothetical protein [Micromonospora musae]RKN22412.1 hypothetical protein D7147_06995 [Micromonospora musae]
MSGSALVSAVLVGLAVGVLGRWALPGRRAAPLWLTLALGVAAALLGSTVARLAGADLDSFPGLRLTVQVGCAGGAVLLALLTTGATVAAPPSRAHPAAADAPDEPGPAGHRPPPDPRSRPTNEREELR